MLTKEENELVCRVGPGTPMGNLMRQYWVPALMSQELAERDCPPLRVLLLGEQLIAFRDTNGQVGLIGGQLSASRSQPLLRAERGVRHPVRLPRLEVRHDWPMCRHALGAGREQLQGQDQGDGLPMRRASRFGLDLHGTAHHPAASTRP